MNEAQTRAGCIIVGGSIEILKHMRINILLALALVLQLSTAVATTGKAVPQTAFRVLKAEFGLVGPGGFRPSTTVPLRNGQGFGWVIQLEVKKDRIKWREELRLPAAPQTWQADEANGTHTMSADGKTSILEQEARIEDGLIYNFWQITPGDPKGRYTMRVMIEGLLVSTFDFDVE